MSKHHNQSNKHSQPIRNIKAFLKAYMQSESGQRSLNRAPRMIERSAKNAKGETVKWREYGGGNQLAHALLAAANG